MIMLGVAKRNRVFGGTLKLRDYDCIEDRKRVLEKERQIYKGGGIYLN